MRMLEVRGLYKGFADESKHGRVRAVDDVSFTVRQGDFFTMLGPSGCGKTTTLRCIAGLEKPTRCSIRLPAAPRSRAKDTHKRSMAMTTSDRSAAIQHQT